MLSHRIVVLEKGGIISDMTPEGQIPRVYGGDTAQKRRMLDTILQNA